MDFQEAQARRFKATARTDEDRGMARRKRAADARLRRAIRDAFARQASAPATTEPGGARRLRAVSDHVPPGAAP